MMNQLIRYIPLIRFIERYHPISICETGSGSYGIGKFLDIEFTGVDSTFDDYSASVVQNTNKKMKQVVTSAARIPLQDKSFDLVFTLDMFEHLHPQEREQALDEMVRLARKWVIVGFPCGEFAKKADKRLQKYYQCTRRKIPGWLSEHMQGEFPSDDFLDTLLKRKGYQYSVENNDNIHFHFLLALFESLPFCSTISEWASCVRGRFVRSLFGTCSFGTCYRKIYIIELT
ncbi:MAG TPA: class I SAM-dependent methyltransferase [Patescibacteria group bacterium]|nr:class I SAM-dependent methyltransferase [Patescibacteria group bacterium]